MPPETTSRPITSAQNANVKLLRRALTHGELVDGLCGIDSPHLIEAAAGAGLRVATLFLSESASERFRDLGEQERLVLPDSLFRQIVSVENPQGVAALVTVPVWEPEMVLRQQRALAVVSAGIQDPGNFGTLIRSAEAFGASAVVALKGTVSHWNPKTMRASAGSVFRLPILEMDDVSELTSFGFRVLVADSHRGEIAPAADLKQKVAIVVGNEGGGVPKALADQAHGWVRIPHMETVESLNAGIASSLLLYEAFRQRHYKDH